MTQPSAPSAMPRWFTGSVLTLLGLQVGLLWMQGTLLERQHGDLQSLRQDVQDLSESLDQFEGNFDQGASDGRLQPSRSRLHAHRGAVRVRLQTSEEDKDKGVRKEMDDQRKSEREAIDAARDVRSKLSIEENARKAEEKAKVEAETHKLRPLIWAGAAIALLALFVRSWLRRRG